MTLYTAVITRVDFAISCLLNAFTFYPYMIILSPKKKLQRCPKDHHQPIRIRLRSTRLPFRVRILYILQLNFRCHRGWKERRNQTKQRIDTHCNASSSKIMPNIATLFKATTPEKFTGAEVVFSTFIAEHNIPFAAADHFTSPCWNIYATTVRTFFFFENNEIFRMQIPSWHQMVNQHWNNFD